MRQGPEYSQWIDKDKDGRVFLRPPIEIEDYLSRFKSITWIEKSDGTFVLIPEMDNYI